MKKIITIALSLLMISLFSSNPAYTDDAEVLPKGVSRVGVEYRYYIPYDKQYDSDGNGTPETPANAYPVLDGSNMMSDGTVISEIIHSSGTATIVAGTTPDAAGGNLGVKTASVPVILNNFSGSSFTFGQDFDQGSVTVSSIDNLTFSGFSWSATARYLASPAAQVRLCPLRFILTRALPGFDASILRS